MKKELLISIFLFFTFISYAQHDTTYYRVHSSYPSWVTTSKDSAQYYCITPFEKVDNLYHIKYYYANGNVLEEGFSENTRGSKKQGKYSYYDKSGRKTIEKNYTDGYLDGKQISFFKDGTIQTLGIRKNKQWHSGTFLFNEGMSRGIDEYKNGEQIGSFRYYSDSKQIAEKLVNEGKEVGTKLDFNNATRIFYDRKGNEIGRLKRKGGMSFGNGKKINFYNSDNLVYAISVRSKIPYANGKENGEAIFYDKNGKIIAQGIYKNGFKHSGVFYEGDTFLHYKNGVQREKVLGYNNDGEVVATGIIKNEEPWEGTFINEYPFRSKGEINSYVEGRVEGKQTYFYDRNFKKIHFYQHLVNDRKEGEFALFDKKGNQLSKGIYKDKEPWEGTFYNERNRETSTYQEGILHGDFFQLNQKGDTIYFATYRHGKLNGFVKIINPNDGKRYECFFRNGNPTAGELFEKDRNTLRIFKEGELTEIHRYGNDGDKSIPYQIEKYKNNKRMELIFNEQGQQYHLILKNGEPFDGNQFEVVDGNLFQHIYTQGTLTQTFFSDFEVNYFSNGFETKEKSCKDCVLHKVAFSDENKTSGMVTFGEKLPENFIRFAEGKIVEINMRERLRNENYTNWEVGKSSHPIIKIPLNGGETIFQFESYFQINIAIPYLSFINIREKLFDNGKISYFLKGSKKPFAHLNIFDGKKIQGIEIEGGENGLYYLEKIENKNTVLDKEGITLEEVLKICKENN